MQDETKMPTPLEDVIERYYEGNQTNLATFLGVTPQAVGQWVKRGFLPTEQARKVAACHWRVKAADLIDPELVRAVCGKRGKRR